MATTKTSKAPIIVNNIKSRDYTRFGVKYEGKAKMGHHAEIVVGESITLFGEDPAGTRTIFDEATKQHVLSTATVPYRRTFRIGDPAEYDSYNMHYTGTIVSIGEKTIGIQPDGSKHVRRLDLSEFDWRNYDLDLKAIAERNADVMMHC